MLDGLHQLDITDGNKERQFDHLFERLFTVRGMQKVLIIDKEGNIVANSLDEPDDKNYLFLFGLMEAEKIGEVFKREIPEFMSIAASSQKYILTSYNQFYVILKMEHKTKLDVILPLLKQALA